MDPEEEVDVFSEPDSSSNVDIRDPTTLSPKEFDKEEEEEQEEDEEEDEEENDAKNFNAWLSQYRAAERRKTNEEEEEEDEESDRGSTGRKNSFDLPLRARADRRASLPCPATLSAMQLSRLHSATKAPVTARALRQRFSIHSTSEDSALGPAERRPSIIPTIPEGVEQPERKTHFRRRNVMSLSDADRVCLICHGDLNKGGSGIRELQCTHSFHSECIEEWLWRKQACPTCRVQVVVPGLHWGSTRVKVP